MGLCDKMKQQTQKKCADCIGNMEKYSARCGDCWEHDSHMTKVEALALKKQLAKKQIS